MPNADDTKPIDLDAIEARLNAATPGPWECRLETRANPATPGPLTVLLVPPDGDVALLAPEPYGGQVPTMPYEQVFVIGSFDGDPHLVSEKRALVLVLDGGGQHRERPRRVLVPPRCQRRCGPRIRYCRTVATGGR